MELRIVDDHVRTYRDHGRRFAKLSVQRRRSCMSAPLADNALLYGSLGRVQALPTLLLVSSDGRWANELKRNLPELEVRHWPDIGDPADIDYALVWMPEPGLLKRLTNLKVVFSIAAGVDHILRDPDLPRGIPIIRMHDPYQVAMMSEFAVAAVLSFHRALPDYARNQVNALWQEPEVLYTPDMAVGVLGLGDIGRDIAAKLGSFGFQIHGWTRTPRTLPGVTCHDGLDGLAKMLPVCRYVVIALPPTPATHGLINAQRLALMPRGAYLVNLGRGIHIVDSDLLAALDSGQIGGALLDVFAEEPLPSKHPYWRHPRVIVTPHSAGELLPRTAAKSVAADIGRHQAGETLTHVYDQMRGY